MPTEPELPLVVAYLAVLHAELAGEADAERMLGEAEAHLREATSRGLADGLSVDAAQRAAIARFGHVQTVANAVRGLTREPVTFDARRGLSAAAIDELRRASRLALMLRKGRDAVLGYWIGDRFAGVLLVGRRDARGAPGLPPARVPIRSLDTIASPTWRHVILPSLEAGMAVSVELWAGQPRLWFGPIPGGTLSAGHSTATQISLAFPLRGGAGKVRLHP
jgi:HAAS